MNALPLLLRADWAARNLPALPAQPGVYAVTMPSDAWLRSKGLYEHEPSRELITTGGRIILYVGATVRTVQSRLREHLLGCAYLSTLRQSLACLLAPDLRLEPLPGLSLHLGSGELALNRWIAENLELAVGVTGTPLAAERALVALHRPPLNLHDGELTPFSRYLRGLRSEFQSRRSSEVGPRPSRAERLAAYDRVEVTEPLVAAIRERQRRPAARPLAMMTV